MAISPKTSKILWSSAAGHCSFPQCKEKLYEPDAGQGYTTGEMAHINGEKPGSNRYDCNQAAGERDGYSNLILLCPMHHTAIDKPENEKKYSAEVLHAFKRDHERYVHNRMSVETFPDKRTLARAVLPLLIENHQVFLSFGPGSDVARMRPMSDAHKIWHSERLSTIAPNNRNMAAIVRENLTLFSEQEQVIAATFLAHVRSYEDWVSDTISYEGVVRFPTSFDRMIRDLANAC